MDAENEVLCSALDKRLDEGLRCRWEPVKVDGGFRAELELLTGCNVGQRCSVVLFLCLPLFRVRV